jgi:N-acetylmuramoyl-L-alanine amidase
VWVLVKVFLLFHLITLSPLTLDAKDFTLVIDAGHGGRDTGAVGKGKVKEKNLTLRYALAFGKMVEQNCPDVKVIYTRKTDTFVELYRRAEIANKNKADLFISIHINALPKGRVARGFQTYTLGTSKRTGKKTGVLENLEVAKRENSVILLEKNYKQTYQGYDPNSPESNIMFEFIQDKNMENSVELAKYMQKYVCQATGRQNMGAQQDNLAVLRLSSMPGCLVECGFISTSDEESFMNSDAAAGMYARGFFNAFQAYRKNHGGNKAINVQPQPQAKPVPAPVVPEPQLEVKPEPIQEAKPEPVQEVNPEPVQEAKPEVVPEVKPEVVPEVKPEIKPEPQPVAQPVTQPVVSQPQPQPQPQKPVFKVQIFASSTLIKAGDARFKGLSGVGHYQEGGMYKYTVGDSSDYNAAIRLRKEIADKFPQAFIVAFKDGKRMDLNEAIGESKKVKK